LGIDDERVSRAIVDDSSILERHSISGEAFSLPSGLVSGAGEHGQRVDSFTEWNLSNHDVLEPLVFPEVSSELVVEWSNVGDEGCGQESVTDHGHTVFSQENDVLFPAFVLVS